MSQPVVASSLSANAPQDPYSDTKMSLTDFFREIRKIQNSKDKTIIAFREDLKRVTNLIKQDE